MLAFEAARLLGADRGRAVLIDTITSSHAAAVPSKRAAILEEILASADIALSDFPHLGALFNVHFDALLAYQPASANLSVAEIRSSRTDAEINSGKRPGARRLATDSLVLTSHFDHYAIVAPENETELLGILNVILSQVDWKT